MNFLTFLTILLVTKSTMQGEMLKVLHLSAFHSSFEPMKHGKVTQYGIARIVAFVKQQKEVHPSTIFIDTMDWFTGSIWYTVHKANICSHFYNILPVDVIGLGHEETNACITEEERTKNFTDFILSIKDKKIVCANCEVPRASPIHDIIKKSVVLEVNEFPHKVGITAFVRKSLVWKFSEGGMTVSDELKAVEREVEEMTHEGIKVIIVIAHGQASFNTAFTKKLKDVDLVIGGHAHQLLYNGKPPSKDSSAGEYPQLVADRVGNTMPVVYAGCYGHYVGELNMYFDDEGLATVWNGNPVHMSSDRPEDGEAANLLYEFKLKVDAQKTLVLGRSRVFLNRSCYWDECNFGSFVADAFVDYAAKQFPSTSRYWTDHSIALVHGKYFAADIVPVKDDNYEITVADVLAAVVRYEHLYTLTINGSVLEEVMEYAVSDDTDETTPRFLQISGLHVVYDMNNDVNERVVKLSVRCALCEIPEYLPVDENMEYKIVTTNVLANGFANFNMFKTAAARKSFEVSDVEVIKNYIRKRGVIQPPKDERIIMQKKGKLKLRTLDTNGVIKYRTGYLLYAFSMFPFAILLER